MVEMASKKFVCIVDDTKLVDGLGGSGCAPHTIPLYSVNLSQDYLR